MFGNRSSSHRSVSARRRIRPRLDVLEDRSLLSTLTVTSPADSGPGTLRDQVAAAASGDTIQFDPSLVGQTITLTTGPVVDIGKSLNIVGPGASNLAISGNDSSVILEFFTGADSTTPPSIDVTISGLTLTHGNNTSFSGGAMVTYKANVTLKDSVIRDSYSAYAGGGFDAQTFVDFSAPPANTVTIINSQFLNNTSGSVGGAYEGYGITLSISGSSFDGNTAPNLAGGVVVGGASVSVSNSSFTNNTGGGISHFAGYQPGTDQLSVSNSTFTGNIKANGMGGAIENNGGTATITGSTFTNNVTSDPYFTQGGAVALSGGDAFVDHSTFIGNRADNPNSYEARGGALFIESPGFVARVTNSTFRDNVARAPVASAGAVERSYYPGFYGGGSPETTFTNDTFVNNSAIATSSTARAGAVEISGAVGTVTVANSSFVGNQAIAANSSTSPAGLAQGGALSADGDYNYSYLPSPLTISGTSFVNNAALGGTGIGGGIAEGGAAIVSGGFSTITFNGGTFVGNRAVAGGGGAVPNSAAGLALGGAVRNFFGVPLTISGTTFVGNSAVASDGTSGRDANTAYGGAVSGNVGTLTNAQFIANSAVGGRGGDATGSGNGGRGGDAIGGAIDSVIGPVTNVVFAGNLAVAGSGGKGAGSGTGGQGGDARGGAFITGGTAVSSSRFLGNAALGGRGGHGGASGAGGAGGNATGGAILVNNGTAPTGGLSVTDSTFVLNLAIGGTGGAGTTNGTNGQGLGGAIANLGTAPVVKKRTKFVLNYASTSGDDIYGPYTSN